MNGIDFIQDLAIVALAAGVSGAICRRLGLSVIVGYLLAGVIIGPYTPPFAYVEDVSRIQTLSHVGLVFLMFSIGLGLSLSRFKRMGLPVLLATALGAMLVLHLTRAAGGLVGWTGSQVFFIAAMLTVSSSAVIAKVISGLKLNHDRAGQIALTVTVLEDVVAVVMLALLGAEVAASADVAGPGVLQLLGGLMIFVVLLVSAGLFLVPKLLEKLQATVDEELLTILVAGLLFLMAIISVRAGYSLALGAFLLGAMVADMPQKSAVDKAFAGMRDLFSSVFFVSIGMMIEVRLVAEVWPMILGLGVFTLIVRSLSLTVALSVFGTPSAAARRAGLLLTPIGEFSFVIAQLGISAGVLDARFYPIAVGVSLFTVLVSPWLNRHADPLIAWSFRLEPRWLRRALDSYHAWIAAQTRRPIGGVWWRLSRKRLLQIGGEMLIVTGLLSFSPSLLNSLLQSPLGSAATPLVLESVFWIGLSLICLVLLVAIWRNIAALAMISAETLSTAGNAPPNRSTHVLTRTLGGLIFVTWLLEVAPTGLLPRWAWITLAVAMLLAAFVFARRLVFWHSQWQESLEGVLADDAPAQAIAPAAPRWWESGETWNLELRECTLPEQSSSAGRSVRELAVRTRFGCAIAEINRGGFIIAPPSPDERLYPGDRLLLVGASSALNQAQTALSDAVQARQDQFSEARLEVIRTPTALIDQSLAEIGENYATHVIIVGLERDGQRHLNPGPTERLRADDHLLLLASPDQLRHFQHAHSAVRPPEN
ncbi:cation:proton antiporter [Synoicihabitans lomoniglobus]|uniref:Cation:proton antiporter n=1 Tax=Synoicihabitans lomoniglobus TaxID=2909285 RepID=A0AAF0CQI9_9BACT|nr:cation:proton antiporter [Opitutaceae bacterium LMO-M01]WED66219.1 cation:proton antiporter [Opitutaceae bacterium LMO-M01]